MPEPEQARVIADHLAGRSNRSIARERRMDPKTVGRTSPTFDVALHLSSA
jgi:hypothetical protein